MDYCVPTMPTLRPQLASVAFALAIAVALAAPAVPARASDGDAELDVVYVWGLREGTLGRSQSSSEGVVSYGAFVDRPLLRTGEIAEVIPGLAVTQHSGSGKANQYFLRGFNLDHGTDFSVSLDGAPINLRSNAHGQGYLDLNVLTPELIDEIHYRKGPYFAEVGDFSAAGSAAFSTSRHLAEPYLQVVAGEHGYGRVLGATSIDDRGYLAADFAGSRGPWQNSEALRRGNLVYRRNGGDWSLSAIAYRSTWNSTDQVPMRAVRSGGLSRLGTVDPTDGGTTTRVILAAQRHADEDLEASAYLQRYTLALYSNFTYFLDDPTHGDQFKQAEDRWIAGGSVARQWQGPENWTFKAGGDLRIDHIGSIGLYRTQARRLLSTDREERVDEGSLATYARAAWSQGPWRANLALRFDGYGVDMGSRAIAGSSGSTHQGQLSPKATLAWRASDRVELYADIGRGFHSNDARGAVKSGDLLVPALGGELGLRYEREGLSASVALWGLKLDSELVYSGDAGDTESTHASRREGIEALLNWTPVRGVNVDFSAASTRARYTGTTGGADYIPNALRYVLTGGVSVVLPARSSMELTVRRLGPAPLIEDGSVRSGTSTIANLQCRKNFERVAVFAEVLNLLDRRDNDITYFYASRLPGEPAAGVGDIHFHPMEPRTFRFGVRAAF